MRGESDTERLHRLADLATPFALRVVATLRLVDLMDTGPRQVSELAQAAEVDAGALGQVMRHLTAQGVFEEVAPGAFAPTALGELLRSDGPTGLRPYLDLDGGLGRSDLAFAGMLESVRTGRASYPGMFGASFWDDLAEHRERAVAFDALMATQPTGLAAEVAAGYDWPGTHVVDVGGGTGTQLIEILKAHPELRGTLVDRRSTAEEAERRLAAAGLADRCEVVAGDFFTPLPGGGDVYVLSNILNDWNDADSLAILRRCSDAAGETGRVLIVERLVRHGNAMATASSLRMLVTFGAEQRSLAGLAALAGRLGMTARVVAETRSGVSLVECAPNHEA
jgi:2,7-dihydroxy-5-methyl-1-naphthoate 7-O-methyltransferase